MEQLILDLTHKFTYAASALSCVSFSMMAFQTCILKHTVHHMTLPKFRPTSWITETNIILTTGNLGRRQCYLFRASVLLKCDVLACSISFSYLDLWMMTYKIYLLNMLQDITAKQCHGKYAQFQQPGKGYTDLQICFSIRCFRGFKFICWQKQG